MATVTNKGSMHKVPGVKTVASADTSVFTEEGELPVGSVLWDGMKQIV